MVLPSVMKNRRNNSQRSWSVYVNTSNLLPYSNKIFLCTQVNQISGIRHSRPVLAQCLNNMTRTMNQDFPVGSPNLMVQLNQNFYQDLILLSASAHLIIAEHRVQVGIVIDVIA